MKTNKKNNREENCTYFSCVHYLKSKKKENEENGRNQQTDLNSRLENVLLFKR